MFKNVGNADRVMRVLGAIALGILVLTGYITGTWAVVWGVVAVIVLLTGLVGICPIYLMLRIRTLTQRK